MALIWKANLETEILSRFEEALRALPHIRIRETQVNVRLKLDRVIYEADAILQIEANGRPLTLLVETKHSLYPRDAREALWQLRNLQKAFKESRDQQDTLPVIACESISEGAKEFLQSENVSYFDQGGSLFLADQELYILLDKPPSKKTTRTDRTLFTGRRRQVLLALLQEPESWHQVHTVSQRAFSSPATVSQVLGDLERREWVSTRGSGPRKERKLQRPSELLDALAKHTIDSPRPSLRRFYVPSLKGEDLLQRINKICEADSVAYAITGEWAAQLYSPFLSTISQVRLRFPQDQPLSALTSELKAKDVSEGTNLAVIETSSYGDFLFREQQRGIWLANPIIVYLDLLQSDGRAKEMAEHLRRERIRF
jgi:hypothetical protein